MSVDASRAPVRPHGSSGLRGVYRGWWIVWIGYYTQMITGGAGGWVFGVLILSMQRDFGVKQIVITGVLTQTRWLSGILSPLLGPYVDRHGTRLTMTVTSAMTGVALIGVALAHNQLAFYLAWMLYGIAQPGVGLLGPRVAISNWFLRKRATAFLWFTLGSATAGIVASPIAAVVDQHYGWRWVWVGLGVMAIAIAPLSWSVIRRRPEDVGLLPDGDTPEEYEAAQATARAVRESPWTVGQALRTRSYWLLSFGFLLVSMPASAIFINISGFVQNQGYDVGFGALVVSIYGIGVLFGRPTWGFFLPRVGLHRTMVIFAGLYCVSIVAFALQPGHNLAALNHPWLNIDIHIWFIKLRGVFTGVQLLLFAWTIWLGIAISGSFLLQAQALPDYFGRAIVGRLTGYSEIANVTIAGSAPLITAAVFDRTGGYVPAFLFFAVGCAVATLAFVFAPPPVHPSEREPQQASPSMVAA